MDFRGWLTHFRHLHDAAKRGVLDGSSLADYHAARDELARALLAAQHVAIEPGQRPRRQLRAFKALQVDVTFLPRGSASMGSLNHTAGWRRASTASSSCAPSCFSNGNAPARASYPWRRPGELDERAVERSVSGAATSTSACALAR
jgi:hypothetical protein